MQTLLQRALKARPWTYLAACAGYEDPEAFFIENNSADREGLKRPRILAAFELCQRCEVRRDCLREALSGFTKEEHGFSGPAQGTWAGTSVEDRERVRDLPITEAVEVLEAELTKRIEQRRSAVAQRWHRTPSQNGQQALKNPFGRLGER